MKNKMLRTISVLLIFALTTLAIVSCDFFSNDPNNIFPEGYTGGHGIDFGSKVEYYWVETYEECVAAIELLKSHNSTFQESAIFSYEGELFDTKYCFFINGWKSESVKYGDNPFDRYGADVLVTSYAFFEDVTIDEILYGYVHHYESAYLSQTDYCKSENLNIDFSTIELGYELDENISNIAHHDMYYVYYEEKHLFAIGSYVDDHLSNESIEAVLSSIHIIK